MINRLRTAALEEIIEKSVGGGKEKEEGGRERGEGRRERGDQASISQGGE